MDGDTDARPVCVLGAGGKTARAVVAALVAAGVPVRAARRADADLDTGRGLSEAVAGCRSVWLAVPNMHPHEPAVVQRVLDACQADGSSETARLVYHSVAWPYAPAMPHHVGKAVAEDLVRRSGLTFTVLQPCAYTQNLVPPALAGRIAVPYSLDVPFSFVDLDDVAAATTAVLTQPGHEGATYELGGPVPLSVRQFAAAAGEVLGRDVVAERLSADEWAAGPGAGLPAHVRSGLMAMFAAYDRHGFVAGSRTLAWLLGRSSSTVTDVLRREAAQGF